MRAVMDAITDPANCEVWLMKSAQVGATELLLNTVGYYVDQDPSAVLLVQPTIEMAEAFAKDRLAPMIRDTPALRDKVAEVRARDSGNTLLHKLFPGGNLTLVGANSAASLASRPKRVILCDEVDRFPDSAGSEGDPVSLARKRSLTYWNRRFVAVSTPTVKGSSRIEQGFESGDQRHFWVPCPDCGEFQRLKWAQVKWPDGQPETAQYCCEHCGVLIPEQHKGDMVARYECRASQPFNGIASFHINELYSPWSTWGQMATGFLQAKRHRETLQVWTNTSLGETWEDSGDGVAAHALMTRRESYTSNSLPEGVLLLTVGTDVQSDRLESTVYGWGADEEVWRVEHVVMRGDPGSQALWKDHDALLRRRWQTDDGRELVIEAACIDSGGHYTQHVYSYAATRKRARVWAIKGTAGFGKLAWPKQASKAGKAAGTLFLIGVDTIKDLIYGRLRTAINPGPGYVHFDATFTEADAEQITSERIVYKTVNGRRVRSFKPVSTEAKQEQLDCLVYAYAALQGRGGAKLLESRAQRPVTYAKAEKVETHDELEPAPETVQAKPAEEPAQQKQPPARPFGGRRHHGPQGQWGNWRQW